MNRRLWAFGLLGALCILGCSEGSSESTKPTPSTGCNNNGVLDSGEICDGTNFKEGARVCPNGTVLAEGKTFNDIVCSSSCTVVTSGICVPPETGKVCGNNVLDANEECDGRLFAAGKDVCPAGQKFAPGKSAGDITCNQCRALIPNDVCVADDSYVAECGNDRIDDGELCDGAVFATGMRVCPEGKVFAEGKTEADIVCSDSCAISIPEGVCVNAVNTCGNGELDGDEVCDGVKFAQGAQVCPDGKVFAEGKTEADIVCNNCQISIPEGVCVNEVVETFTCADGHTLRFCIGEECTDEQCPYGCVEVGESAECQGAPEVWSCADEHTLRLCIGEECTDDDCRSKGENFVCRTSKDGTTAGCDEILDEEPCGKDGETECVGDTLHICVANGGSGATNYWMSDNCEERGMACGDDPDEKGEKTCIEKPCDTPDKAECIDDSWYRICVEDVGASYWMTDRCGSKQACDYASGTCKEIVEAPCGNGKLDAGEKCDPELDSQYWYGVSCNMYDAKKLFVSGAPACTAECKVNIAGCVEATEADFAVVKQISFGSMDAIKAMTAGGDAVMGGTFGSGNSEYDATDNGWSLGNWSGTGKYVGFKIGKLEKNGVSVLVDVRRTGAGSPKIMKLSLMDGSKELGMASFNISDTNKQTIELKTKLPSVPTGENTQLRFNASGESSQHVVISNIRIRTVSAI